MKSKTVKFHLTTLLFTFFCIQNVHSSTVTGQNIVSWEQIPTNKFSNLISAAYRDKKSWAETPSLFANYLLDFTELKSYKIEYIADSIEDNTGVTITIIRDGFLDDSVRGDIHVFRVEKKTSKWSIVNVKKSTRCWRGDGSYSNKPCP